MDFVKNTGKEKEWKEKVKELQRQGLKPIPLETWSPHAKDHALKVARQRQKDYAERGRQLAIERDTKTIQSSEPRKRPDGSREPMNKVTVQSTTKSAEVITKGTKQNSTQNAPNESAGEKPVMQATENEKQNTNFNGIRNIETLTKNAPKPIVESETHSSESKQQLTLVKEVISTHMSYIDRSAELIMQRMEQLNKSKYNSDETEMIQQPSMVAIDQTIQLARVMNDLMRTKKDALKTIHEMVVSK